MGAACCVAARDAALPKRTRHEPSHRSITCSPSWSFRWDQRRVAGEVEDSSCQVSHGNSRSGCREIKGSIDSERGNLSDGGSLENFGTPASLKSPVHEEMGVNLLTLPSDISMASNFSTELRSIASHNSAEVKNMAESPNMADTSAQKLSFSISSSFSTPNADPLSTNAHTLPPSSTPSRRARRSPGHQLLRQVSDSRILGLKSPNNYSVSEGRSSFVLSACSNDLTAGSFGGSSDGWSMRTFSELVASQRERWSFDSEHLGFGRGNLSGSSSRFSCSSSVDLQICGACSKLLTERSSWSSQRIVANSELSVVAVLVCGHVYHAECLEIMTADNDRYDPACPICTVGEKQVANMARKALKAEAELKAKHYKISRNRVVDSYLDDDFEDFDYQKDVKHEGKSPKMEASSSTRTRSSSSKPFLRRHFSLGSKWTRSLTENDSVRKKGFWTRYRKD
ncbi:hypothetical protein JRO89_XS07G0034600 [Xanthoceras sorbifolium]|uniref:RING-type domain-containing protein n=1 Tax=Xanthoceras sorbifolium TaxID=99658 RepID=A0ABQ8HSE8_9ROSI|nr:hypothetical protein JRO89_XS07G0034600 [Xanthoceras sorbifolium]